MNFKLIIKALRNRIPKDFLQVFLFDIVSKVLLAITAIFLIKVLTTEDYSLYVKFNTVSSLILNVIGAGLSIAFVRFATEDLSRGNNSIDKLYSICNFTIIGLTLLLLLAIPVFVDVYNISFIAAILALLYGSTLSLNKMNQSYFQAKEKFSQSGVIDNVKNVLLCVSIIVIYFLLSQLQIEYILIIYVACVLLSFIAGFYIIRLKRNVKSDKLSMATVKKIFGESIWLIIYCIILNLFDQSSVLMLTNILDDKAVAEYGVALKYYSLMLTFLASIQTVIRIRTSKKEMVDSAERRSSFTIKWLRKTWKIAVPIMIISIISCDFIFPFLNGIKYNNSIPAFKILSVGVCISYMFATNVSVMMSAKRHKELCLICFISLGINILVNYTLLPIWGINAAAFGTVLANAVLNITCFVLIVKSKAEKV